jgi:hypothetical protein
MNLKFININININIFSIFSIFFIFSVYSIFFMFLVDVAFAETLARDELPKIFLEIQDVFYRNSSIPLEEQYNGVDLYGHFLLILLRGAERSENFLAILTPELCRDYFALLHDYNNVNVNEFKCNYPLLHDSINNLNINEFKYKYPAFSNRILCKTIIFDNLNIFFSTKDLLDSILDLDPYTYEYKINVQIAKHLGPGYLEKFVGVADATR